MQPLRGHCALVSLEAPSYSTHCMTPALIKTATKHEGILGLKHKTSQFVGSIQHQLNEEI